MLHKLIDTASGAEIISDDKWLPVYQRRAGVKYIGPVEESAEAENTDAPASEDTTTKRKKSK